MRERSHVRQTVIRGVSRVARMMTLGVDAEVTR